MYMYQGHQNLTIKLYSFRFLFNQPTVVELLQVSSGLQKVYF